MKYKLKENLKPLTINDKVKKLKFKRLLEQSIYNDQDLLDNFVMLRNNNNYGFSAARTCIQGACHFGYDYQVDELMEKAGYSKRYRDSLYQQGKMWQFYEDMAVKILNDSIERVKEN